MQLCTFLEVGFANFHVIFHMHQSKLIVPTRNALAKLEKKEWYFVTKIVLTYCEKKLF